VSESSTSLVAHRALAEASRIRILEELRSENLDVPTLSERLGLHINTIRAHMEVLAEAGMVTSRPVRLAGRGRPRVLYQLVPGKLAGPDAGYRMLAKVLAGHLATISRNPAAAAEAAGEVWGRSVIETPRDAPSVDEATDRLVRLLADLGFAPEATQPGSRREILLHHCPFREAVEQNQEVVCAVHLGLLRGALREMGAPIEATELRPLVGPSLCVAKFGGPELRPTRR
jgi:predicted ArsR family transcriptional regulator